MRPLKALTIAGSDSGGGAGIQADLKTFQELGVYGMSSLTAVTAQNTLGVQGVYPLEAGAVAQQLDSIGEDLTPDALKTGMLFSSELIRVVAAKIRHYGWTNLVIDPVMVAKGGSPLLLEEAVAALRSELLPLAEVVTPNLPEAEILTGLTIRSLADKEEAARQLIGLGARCAVIKGGHDQAGDRTVDLLYDGRSFDYLEAPRILTRHTHGTGCTFSAAITAGLACGMSLSSAVRQAKAFIQAAIEDSLGIGGGHGPTNHFAYQQRLRGGSGGLRVDPDTIRRLLGVYFIMGSPNTGGRAPEEVLREAIAGGATLFQYREKGPGALVGSDKRDLAARLQGICREAGVPFLVNDDVPLAAELDADGVHVGQSDEPAAAIRAILGPDKIIGVSAHTLAEAQQAIQDGADYIGVGPVYPTSSKDDAEEACGPERIAELRAAGIRLPLVAIGGLTHENGARVLAAGADGLSVISAIAGAPDVRAAAAAFAALLR